MLSESVPLFMTESLFEPELPVESELLSDDEFPPEELFEDVLPEEELLSLLSEESGGEGGFGGSTGVSVSFP